MCCGRCSDLSFNVHLAESRILRALEHRANFTGEEAETTVLLFEKVLSSMIVEEMSAVWI